MQVLAAPSQQAVMHAPLVDGTDMGTAAVRLAKTPTNDQFRGVVLDDGQHAEHERCCDHALGVA